MDKTNINPVELLQNLIRFDTSNPPGNEKECIKYLNEIFKNAGFETQILAKDPNRPNLITRLKGQGKASPLLLYGHIDVVPVQNQDGNILRLKQKLQKVTYGVEEPLI